MKRIVSKLAFVILALSILSVLILTSASADTIIMTEYGITVATGEEGLPSVGNDGNSEDIAFYYRQKSLNF